MYSLPLNANIIMSNFHESAEDITVEDGHILKAVLNNIEGEGCDAEIDLSECIGNEDGQFVWGGAGKLGSPIVALGGLLR